MRTADAPGGRLRVIKDDVLLAAPALTLAVDTTNERGLLGVALDPDFASNGFLYVSEYSERDPLKRKIGQAIFVYSSFSTWLHSLRVVDVETRSATPIFERRPVKSMRRAPPRPSSAPR